MLYDQKYFSLLQKSEAVEFPRNLRLFRLILKYQKKPGQLLDVGIGTGLFIKITRSYDWKVYGIDISSFAIKQAQKMFAKDKNVRLFKADLLKTKFKNNFFEAINMRHSLEHLDDPQQAIKKSFQLLKSGGVLCVAVPNSKSPHALLFGFSWPHLDLKHHKHFFTSSSLQKLVKQSGFQVLEVKTEELTFYDPLKLILYKLKLWPSYWKVSPLARIVNNLLPKFFLGEGLVVVARKP